MSKHTSETTESIAKYLVDLRATWIGLAESPFSTQVERVAAAHRFQGAAKAASIMGLGPADAVIVATDEAVDLAGDRPGEANAYAAWESRAVTDLAERLASLT